VGKGSPTCIHDYLSASLAEHPNEFAVNRRINSRWHTARKYEPGGGECFESLLHYVEFRRGRAEPYEVDLSCLTLARVDDFDAKPCVSRDRYKRSFDLPRFEKRVEGVAIPGSKQASRSDGGSIISQGAGDINPFSTRSAADVHHTIHLSLGEIWNDERLVDSWV
jgi:hypothetical protein